LGRGRAAVGETLVPELLFELTVSEQRLRIERRRAPGATAIANTHCRDADVLHDLLIDNPDDENKPPSIAYPWSRQEQPVGILRFKRLIVLQHGERSGGLRPGDFAQHIWIALANRINVFFDGVAPD
jgi:hypothetical protein